MSLAVDWDEADRDLLDALLDEALGESFPASDPPALPTLAELRRRRLTAATPDAAARSHGKPPEAGDAAWES
ncbi:hypothetical protein [Albimonas pacifica]|nr:hypothetical protein [Albimonas pacifica]